MSFIDKFKKRFERKTQQSVPKHVQAKQENVDKTKEDQHKHKTDGKPRIHTEEKAEHRDVHITDFKAKDPSGRAADVVVRPLQTEKVSDLMVLNKYSFEVAPRATKNEIKKAIQVLYGVTAKQVAIINVRGKSVRYGRVYSQRKNWRKAMVTLKPGEKIEVFEGV